MICPVCFKEFNSKLGVSVHLTSLHPTFNKEEFFLKKKGLKEKPACVICGEPAKFLDMFKGYNATCGKHSCHVAFSENCAKKSLLKKYGVDNPIQVEGAMEKSIASCMKTLGVKRPMQNSRIRLKQEKTCEERFGVYNWSKTEDFQVFQKENRVQLDSKIKNSLRERYGVDSIFSVPSVRDKIKQTLLDKYGVDNYSKTSFHKEDMKKWSDKIWKEKGFDKPELLAYRSSVESFSEKSLRTSYSLIYSNSSLNAKVAITRGAKRGIHKGCIHLDHRFSILEGFLNKIPPEIMGSPVNLRFLTLEENVSKSSNCEFDKDTLFAKYEDYVKDVVIKPRNYFA